jgi:hypothetical protein
LVATAKGGRSLGTHRHRWEDNIKMGLRGITKIMWTGFIWLRYQWWDLVNMVKNLWIPLVLKIS